MCIVVAYLIGYLVQELHFLSQSICGDMLLGHTFCNEIDIVLVDI